MCTPMPGSGKAAMVGVLLREADRDWDVVAGAAEPLAQDVAAHGGFDGDVQ